MMKRLASVARLTFRMQLRQGNGIWLILLTALVGAFFFMVCRADGVLTHELQIRSRYGLTIATGIFGVCLLWLACYSMRGDIEAKRLHLLTSYPLKRTEIYLGKWLGLIGFSALGLFAIMATIGVCCLAFIAQWGNPQEAKALKASGYRVLAEMSPVPFDFDAEIDRQIAQLQEEGRLPERGDFSQVRSQLRQSIRQEQQTLQLNESKTRQFDLGAKPAHGDSILLRYRFYSSDLKKPAILHWTVRSASSAQTFEATTSDYAYSTNDLAVPLSIIPADGRFEVVVRGEDNPELVISMRSGIKALYRQGSLAGNAGKFFISVLLHYTTLIAVGLTIGVAFTISVASFVAVVLYFLALSSAFFQGVLTELSTDVEGGATSLLGEVMIRVGTLFTTGLEPPAVITSLSNAMAITVDNLGMEMTRWFGSVLTSPVKIFSADWHLAIQRSGFDMLLGFTLYLLIAAGLGILLLSRKELDRVH